MPLASIIDNSQVIDVREICLMVFIKIHKIFRYDLSVFDVRNKENVFLFLIDRELDSAHEYTVCVCSRFCKVCLYCPRQKMNRWQRDRARSGHSTIHNCDFSCPSCVESLMFYFPKLKKNSPHPYVGSTHQEQTNNIAFDKKVDVVFVKYLLSLSTGCYQMQIGIT